MVVADPTQIEQIVLNLVVNARDAMPQGGRLKVAVEEVEVRAGGRPGAGRGCQRSVCAPQRQRHGTGIDQEARAAVRTLLRHQSRGKRHGLGLSIVYGIVKQNGGLITLESGRGATFLIRLPVATAADPTAHI
jgi:signal transduction histidine kinase